MSNQNQLHVIESDLTFQLNKLGLEGLLPESVSQKAFVQSAAIAVMNNPKLQAANFDKQSLFSELLICAKDGLVPDGREAVITTFSKKVGQGQFIQTCKYMPMAYGVMKRARQSLEITYITAKVVYMGDEFDSYFDQDGPHFLHREKYESDMVKLAYAFAKDRDGNVYIEVATLNHIFRARDASPSAFYTNKDGRREESQNSPWFKSFDRMAEKVALHRLCKKLPGASELNDSGDYQEEKEVEEAVSPVVKKVEIVAVEKKQDSFESVSNALEKVGSLHELRRINKTCKELSDAQRLTQEQVAMLKSKINNAQSRLSVTQREGELNGAQETGSTTHQHSRNAE